MITKYDNGFKNIMDSIEGMMGLIYKDTVVPICDKWGLKFTFGMGTYEFSFKDGIEVDFEKLVRINDDSDEEHEPFKENYEQAMQDYIKKWPNDDEDDLRSIVGPPIYYNKEFREELVGLYKFLESEVPWSTECIYRYMPLVD